MSTAIITEMFGSARTPNSAAARPVRNPAPNSVSNAVPNPVPTAVPNAVPTAVPTAVRPRLRLTKRGRGVLTTLAAAPLVIAALLFALNGGVATASLSGTDAAFTYTTIGTGQSLWQLAEELAPMADPRDVIADIMQLNQLQSADVMAGQTIAIPDRYLR